MDEAASAVSGGGADLPITLVALLDQAVDVDRLERAEMAAQCGPGGVGRQAVVIVSAPRRLGHDLIRQTKSFQIRGGQLERVGRLDLAGDVAPEDRGASVGRGDAVDGVFYHEQAI